MSIMVNGTLSVQRIQSTRGAFSVGKLDCEIGVLNVKDAYLDQFETGVYRGRFGITKVFSHGYAARTGCFIVETRAVVDEYVIHSDEPDSLDGNIALAEVDPLDAIPLSPPLSPGLVTSVPVRAPTKPVIPKASEVLGLSSPIPSGPTPAGMFGELWPLGDVVKLDPTTIRSDPEGHRARVTYLGANGYRFKASTQSWIRD